MAASPKPTRLQSWIESEMRTRHIPGMAVGVYRYGKPVEIVTRGFADLENKVAVRRQTQFEICSITKQFTAAAVLLLEQDGEMRLDDPIKKYLPELPASWDQVTIRRLLDHTSGVPDRMFEDKFATLPSFQALKALAARPLLSRPGDRWLYNNTGYWLVGLAIEKASGVGFFDFLNDRIFKPLGMKNTFPNRPSLVVPWRARGYSYANGAFANASPLTDTVGYAAGGLISTIDDLNLWSQALTSNKLLSAKSREEMLKPARLNSGRDAWNYAGGGYGLGVLVGSVNGHRIEKHSGGWDDASCQLTRFLDDGITVVVLTNVGGYEQRLFVGERIGHLFVASIQVPSWKVSKDPEPTATPVAQRVLSGLAGDRIPSDNTLTPDCRERLLAGLYQMKGMIGSHPLKSLKLLLRVPQGDTIIYLYRATFKRPVLALVALTADKKVADLQLLEPPGS
jgi:D-alanyl-D-alanine carboxypeptidase